jgi:hypothetical protein
MDQHRCIRLRFIQMGTQIEDVIHGPYTTTLESAHHTAGNFEDELNFMAQSEVKCLQVASKSIGILKFLDR